MNKLKYSSLLLAFVSTLFIGLTACSDDDDDNQEVNFKKPVVTLTEVGHANSGVAHPGSDMHLEANVVAEAGIKRIDIEIHQEGKGSFEIEKSYTEGKYIGVRNIEFHEHIDIPESAPLGEYHLHFTVTDNLGQQTTAETHVELAEGGDDDDDDD